MPHRRLALAASAVFLIGAAYAPVVSAQGAPAIIKDPAGAPAGVYKLDPRHASATLKVAHMGLSRYTMHFTAISGQFSYDPAHPSATQISVAVDPKSIQTDDAKFNTEIADQFLEADKFPTLTFTSTKVVPEVGDKGVVEGVLDFHGVKKPVALHVTYRGFTTAMGQQRMGFSGETMVKRSEFGASKYVPLVGDDVTVLVEVEFTKQ